MRAGDFAAERRLFERHRAALIERARRHRRMQALTREVTPEDVVQEVFVRALSAGLLQRFEHRGAGSLAAALGVILERTLVDMSRRFGATKRGGALVREPLDALIAGAGAPAAPVTTPTARARADELFDICRRRLPAREWEVWRAIEVEGLEIEAAAARLGATPDEVRDTLFRARAELIRHIERLPGYRPER